MPQNNGYAPNGYGVTNGQSPGMMRQSKTLNTRGPLYDLDTKPILGFEYKPSPFYEIVARIGDVRICDGLFDRL